MLFSSSGELLVVASFLLLQLLLRQWTRNAFQKGLLLLGNLVILSTVLTWATLLMHGSITLVIYLLGRYVSRTGVSRGKALTATGIITVILLFCVRSYPKTFGISSFQLTDDPGTLLQRLGISYIMFRHIQFLVDSFKRKIRHFAFIDYLNFVLFFPNFLAGPIDVYNNFKRWSDRPEDTFKKALILPGLGRIMVGFIKKYALVPLIYVSAISYEPWLETLGGAGALLMSLLYYSMYIYLDFSGYSDIAIGSGYLMGVRTPENFRMPYLATNISDFWRRWHITFSTFLRELIFKPIVKGISRWKIKPPRLAVSIIGYILTFFICGVWHGDTSNFIWWGLWHGVGLSVYKAWSSTKLHDRIHTSFGKKKLDWMLSVVGWLLTFSFVTFGWVFFNYANQDLETALKLLLP